jgi:hypothetical protein
MVAKVFISYRRDDSAGHTGRVHDRLEYELGSGLLFMDVDSIPLGVNFIKILRDEVAKCEVLLAVIGPNWLNAHDEQGRRRLDDPHDFVRIEIATALQRDITVIPILLDGAPIPKSHQLPKDLRELAVRNGLEIRHASFHSDMEKLIRTLKRPSGRDDAPTAAPVPSEGQRRARPLESKPAAAPLARGEADRIGLKTGDATELRPFLASDAQDPAASQASAKLRSERRLSTTAMTISGSLAAVIVAAILFWFEGGAPALRQQALPVPSPSPAPAMAVATAAPPAAPAVSPMTPSVQPTPTHPATTTSPEMPPAERANTPPLVQEKTASAGSPSDGQPDASLPINDPGLLREVRERLYELNFDPGPLDGPSTGAAGQAIREFEQQNNLPPTGIATTGLLQRLRAMDALKPWGTIVYGKDNGKWGMAWGETTRIAAVAHARRSCGDVNSCAVEISFFGSQCGAFAHSGTSWAIVARDNVGDAKDAALTDCGKRGKSCEVVAAVCADGANRMSAAK